MNVIAAIKLNVVKSLFNGKTCRYMCAGKKTIKTKLYSCEVNNISQLMIVWSLEKKL